MIYKFHSSVSYVEVYDLYQVCAVPFSAIWSESCLFPKYLRNQMGAGIPLWEHWPTCNDVSAFQCLRLFWSPLAYIGNLDVANSEPCSGVRGLGICVLLLFSPSAMSDSLWPVDYSTPGFPVLYHLPVFAQTHAHWVNDAIQPSHPLSYPFFPAFNLSQYQDLF